MRALKIVKLVFFFFCDQIVKRSPIYTLCNVPKHKVTLILLLSIVCAWERETLPYFNLGNK